MCHGVGAEVISILMDKPKECVHSNCTNIMYVPEEKLHMMLICEECQENHTIRNGGSSPES